MSKRKKSGKGMGKVGVKRNGQKSKVKKRELNLFNDY